MLPFSAQDILRGVKKAYANPINAPQVRQYPRASGLSSCARAQAYSMAGAPGDKEWNRHEMAFTQEQGRLAEEITVEGIYEAANGTVEVVGVGEELSVDAEKVGYTGHPDGELHFRHNRGAAAHIHYWDDVDDDGLKWGFEHKHYGSYGYQKIQKGGILTGGADVINQCILYGYALEWDKVLICITAQDGSVNRRDLTRARKYKDPAKRWPDFLEPGMDNPKLLMFEVDLRPYYKTILPRLLLRAKALTEVAKSNILPAEVVREFEPEGMTFPCSYCDHYDTCVEDGQGNVPIPVLSE